MRFTFLTYFPPCQITFASFHEDLLRMGHEVSIIDMTPVFRPGTAESLCLPPPEVALPLVTARTMAEAVEAVRNIPRSDLVISLLHYDKRTRHIYRAMRASRLRLIGLFFKQMPMAEDFQEPRLADRLRAFRKKYLSLNKIIRTVALSHRLPAELVGMPSAVAHVVVNKNQIPNLIPAGPRTRIIATHSMDYDASLKRKARPDSPELDHLRKKRMRPLAVFLEACAPIGPDSRHANEERYQTQEVYYPELLNFFGRLRDAGLDLVVAAHPKAPWKGRLEYFDGLAIHQGKSEELVALADLVVMHYSTAISYPVLHRKPILFITTDQINQGADGDFLLGTARALGKHPLNISGPYAVDLDKAMRLDEAAYLRFERTYIRSSGDDKRLYWEIVLDELAAMGLLDQGPGAERR